MKKIMGSMLVICMMVLFCGTGLAVKQPNILLVMVDDMGWTDIGCIGSEIETPTLLEFAGVDYPDKYKGRQLEPMRGRSMVSLLDGTKKAVYTESEYVGGEMAGGKWMRQGDLKAVKVPKPYGTDRWQLFNVIKDPGESNDLSKSMPDKLNELKAAWDDYAEEVGVIPAE